MKELGKCKVPSSKINLKYENYFDPVIKQSQNSQYMENKMNLNLKQLGKFPHKSDSLKENDNSNAKRRVSLICKPSGHIKHNPKSCIDVKNSISTLEYQSLPEMKRESDEVKTSNIKVIGRFRDENQVEKVISLYKKETNKRASFSPFQL